MVCQSSGRDDGGNGNSMLGDMEGVFEQVYLAREVVRETVYQAMGGGCC